MKVFEVLGFKDNETGMPTYDDMMANPDYFAQAKKRKGGIVMMSPDEYINRSVKGFKKFNPDTTLDNLIKSRDLKLIDKYAQEMQSGDKFPTVMLDYSMGFSQEGLHRALAAKQIGINEIPVMIVSMIKKKRRGNALASY